MKFKLLKVKQINKKYIIKIKLNVILLTITSMLFNNIDPSFAQKRKNKILENNYNSNDEPSDSIIENINENEKDKGNITKVLKLEEIVDIVLENNELIRQQALDVLKSDSDLLKNDTQYSTILDSGYNYRKTKNLYTNSFTSGDTIDLAESYVKIKKLFSSGTYFELGVSDRDIKANDPPPSIIALGNSLSTGNSVPIFSPKNLHTTGLTFLLTQELLKNAFGFNQRRIISNLRERTDYLIETLTYQLGNLVVQTLVSYWQLKIADELVRTNQRLLNNLITIRDITRRKANLGISENFEVSQWNALIIITKSNLEQNVLKRNSQERDLLRLMNLNKGTVIRGVAKLKETKATDIKISEDLDLAYNTRPDLRALVYQKLAAKRNLEIAKNSALPSLTIGASANGQGFGDGFNNSFNNSYRYIYPDYQLNFKFSYPFDDPAPKTDIRNALIDLEKLNVQERQLRRQISDDILQGSEEIDVTYNAVIESKKALDTNRSYYAGLLNRFRQGRFNATFIKNALDSIVQSENTVTQALVNYNIALVRYDLTRNILFKKYKVDIKKLISKYRNILEIKKK